MLGVAVSRLEPAPVLNVTKGGKAFSMRNAKTCGVPVCASPDVIGWAAGLLGRGAVKPYPLLKRVLV